MAFFPIQKIANVLSRMPGDEKGLLAWLKKEGWGYFQRSRDVVNWAVDYLGLAGVDESDDPGTLETKLENSPSAYWTKHGNAGSRTLQVNVIPVAMQPPQAEELKSYLFPAKVGGALDAGQVACCFLGSHNKGGNDPMMAGQFTEVSSGVFRRSVAGPLPSSWLDGVDPDTNNPNGSSLLGKTVMAYYQGDHTIGNTEEPLQGPYILDDLGGHWENYGTPTARFVSTYATLRRHPDFNTGADFVQGTAWQVQTGNLFGVKWLELTTAQPITLGTTALAFSEETTNPNLPSYELLTASQLSEASVDTVVASATIKSSDGVQSLLMVDVASSFETRAGTPGTTTIAAGKLVADMLAKVSSTATGRTTLRARVLKDTGGSQVQLYSYDSSDVTNTADFAIKQISQAITSQDISGARLLFNIQAQTTSPTDITVSVVVNDAARSTRVSLPIELVVGGAEDHRQLTHRDAADQHPWNAIEPAGQAVHPMPSLTIASGGKLTLGAGNVFVVNPNGQDLTQISVPSCPAYTTVPIRLIFTGPARLQHAQVPSSGFAPLYLNADGSPLNPVSLFGDWTTTDWTWVGGQWVLNFWRDTQ